MSETQKTRQHKSKPWIEWYSDLFMPWYNRQSPAPNILLPVNSVSNRLHEWGESVYVPFYIKWQETNLVDENQDLNEETVTTQDSNPGNAGQDQDQGEETAATQDSNPGDPPPPPPGHGK